MQNVPPHQLPQQKGSLMATQLTVQQQRANEMTVLRQTIGKMEAQIKMALPAHIPVEKFHRVAVTAISSNPDLLNVDRTSLFGALMKADQDGTLPDGRQQAARRVGKRVGR